MVGALSWLYSREKVAHTIEERERELWECENFLEGERKEMVELYQLRGLSLPEATEVVSIISRRKDAFVDIMLAEELLLRWPPNEEPCKECT